MYDHFKKQFKIKADVFGRVKMDIEKEKMANIISREIAQCGSQTDGTPPATAHFCDNYEKDEFLMIDEVRNSQAKRSMEIISTLQHDSTKPR